MYKSLCGHMFLFILDKYLGLNFLDISVNVNLTRNCQKFAKVVASFSTPLAIYEISSCFRSLLILHIVNLLNFSPSTWCVWWYILMVLICIALKTNNVKSFMKCLLNHSVNYFIDAFVFFVIVL